MCLKTRYYCSKDGASPCGVQEMLLLGLGDNELSVLSLVSRKVAPPKKCSRCMRCSVVRTLEAFDLSLNNTGAPECYM